MTVANKRASYKIIFTRFSSEAFGKLTSISQSSLNITCLIESVIESVSSNGSARSEMLTEPPNYKCRKG